MSFGIAQNDLRSHLRSGVFIALASALLALLIGAAALSSNRLASFEYERTSAEQTDRKVWDSQGERNPHSAAHFARYAFKPVSELMAFDPGVTDYAGLALWMEAHNQNPAIFRRAEDLGQAGRFGDLSPAWILQYIAPLFLFLVLFASIAGEREQGTFRQLVASGMSARSILGGKLLSGFAVVAVLLVVSFGVSTISSTSGSASVLSDGAVRGFGLALAYSLYLVAVAALAIGVSALCREKRTALISLVAIWTVCFVLIPRLAASAAVTAYPVPDATEVTADLKEASDAFFQDQEYRDRIDREVLEEYDVETIEELPINYGGYSLQMSEKHAEPLFEAVYSRLDAIYERQEALVGIVSLVSPVLAIEVASAGLAGTDRLHHSAFVWDAEQHRRMIVEQLNDDLKYNAAPDQTDYTNDRGLWSEIPDFSHRPPTFLSVAGRYITSLLVLLAYAVGAVAFATIAIRRARTGVAS